MPELVQPADMPPVLGLRVPLEFYCVSQHPAPLAGMPCPSKMMPWPIIAGAGFCHVVCLNNNHPRYNPSPLTITYATDLQDLVGGKLPRDPMVEERLIHEAAHAVVGKLQRGEGVVVHCAGGTGRSGTVIGCVLRVLGVSPPTVVAYLDKLHKARGRCGWPESPWQSAVVERFQSDAWLDIGSS
jgi:hypothetical protein